MGIGNTRVQFKYCVVLAALCIVLPFLIPSADARRALRIEFGAWEPVTTDCPGFDSYFSFQNNNTSVHVISEVTREQAIEVMDIVKVNVEGIRIAYPIPISDTSLIQLSLKVATLEVLTESILLGNDFPEPEELIIDRSYRDANYCQLGTPYTDGADTFDYFNGTTFYEEGDDAMAALVGSNENNGVSAVLYTFWPQATFDPDGAGFQWAIYSFPNDIRLIRFRGITGANQKQVFSIGYGFFDTIIGNSDFGDDGYDGEYMCFRGFNFIGIWNEEDFGEQDPEFGCVLPAHLDPNSSNGGGSDPDPDPTPEQPQNDEVCFVARSNKTDSFFSFCL